MPRVTDLRLMRLVACAPVLLLAGCLDPFRRADDLWSYSGNAVAANKLAQTIDPWPRAARDPHFVTNGARIGEAMQRYRTNQPPVAPPAAAPSTR
mgnify:CR=1 FL=1